MDRWVLIAVVLLVVTLACIVAVLGSDALDGPISDGPDVSETRPPSDPPQRHEPSRTPGVDAAGTASGPDETEPASAHDGLRQHVLRLRSVTGVGDGIHLLELEVIVPGSRPGGALPIRTAVPVSALPIDVDVTGLVSRRTDMLDISARYGDRARANLRVALARCEQAHSESRVVYLVDLALVGVSRFTGVVLDPIGDAAPAALVSLFRIHDERPDGDAIATVAADEQGRFELESGGVDRGVLVACASPHRPGHVVVQGDLREDLTIRLRAGLAIRGAVTRRAAPFPAAKVAYRLVDGESAAFGVDLTWTPAGPESSFGRARTDEEGRFGFDGLAPVAYLISVGNSVDIPTHNDFSPERTVVAPASDVLIEIAGAEIHVLMEGDGSPVEHAALTLRSATSGQYWIDVRSRSDRVMVMVAPATRYALQIEHPDYEPFAQEIESPGAGEIVDVTARLERRVQRRGIAIRLEGGAEGGVEELALQLRAPRRLDESLARMMARRQFESLTATLREDGTYRIDDLDYPVGAYSLLVRPGGRFNPDQCSPSFVDLVTPLELPAQGFADVALTLGLGGRLRIVAHDAAGVFLSGRARLTSPDGREVEADTSDARDVLVPAEAAPALPAGRYDLEVTCAGYRAASIAVTVKANEIVAVNAALTREP